jgi:hypothetical protein
MVNSKQNIRNKIQKTGQWGISHKAGMMNQVFQEKKITETNANNTYNAEISVQLICSALRIQISNY